MLSRTVLLVEDEPHWQTVVGAALRSIDPEVQVRCVRTVNDAEQALFETSHFDLIISDHLLDGPLDGVDLWTRCLRHHRGIPFVLLSGCKRERLLRRFEEEFPKTELQLPSILAKSLSPAQLRSRLVERAPDLLPAWSGRWRSTTTVIALAVGLAFPSFLAPSQAIRVPIFTPSLLLALEGLLADADRILEIVD